MKPLFIPLKTAYYNAFALGMKSEELRQYGKRWNENTCSIGRRVLLSRGYGKHERMTGIIGAFKKQHGTTFGSAYKQAIMDVYGTLDIDIACIRIDDLKPVRYTAPIHCSDYSYEDDAP